MPNSFVMIHALTTSLFQNWFVHLHWTVERFPFVQTLQVRLIRLPFHRLPLWRTAS